MYNRPRPGRLLERNIARLARVLARRQRGGNNRCKAARALARAHERLRWKRRDLLHKLSRAIINRYDLIALEKLDVRNMLRSGRGTREQPGTNVRAKARLNFAIADAGWSIFASMLHAKAEEAGRAVVEVDARYSSQTCSSCGLVDPASRVSQALFICTTCGVKLNADVNAAKVILKRAEFAACGEGAPDYRTPEIHEACYCRCGAGSHSCNCVYARATSRRFLLKPRPGYGTIGRSFLFF